MPPDAPDIFEDFDALLELVCKAMTDAARKAVAENDALGIPTSGSRDGKLVWRLPGGRIVTDPPDRPDRRAVLNRPDETHPEARLVGPCISQDFRTKAIRLKNVPFFRAKYTCRILP
jgi:hypothetical protein